MATHPLAGKPAPADMLIDVGRLECEYYERKPDIGDPRYQPKSAASQNQEYAQNPSALDDVDAENHPVVARLRPASIPHEWQE